MFGGGVTGFLVGNSRTYARFASIYKASFFCQKSHCVFQPLPITHLHITNKHNETQGYSWQHTSTDNDTHTYHKYPYFLLFSGLARLFFGPATAEKFALYIGKFPVVKRAEPTKPTLAVWTFSPLVLGKTHITANGKLSETRKSHSKNPTP